LVKVEQGKSRTVRIRRFRKNRAGKVQDSEDKKI
jgi:hypothetical protein